MTTNPSNGTWLLPSRRRPDNLVRFCEALHATKTSTRGLILIQAAEFDDPVLAEAYAALPLPAGWRVRQTLGESQGDKLREVQGLYQHEEWVGLIGDDQLVQTEYWDLKLVEWVKGWNLVSCHDDGWLINERGPNNMVDGVGRFCGSPIWSGELFRATGYIFPPGMHHLFLDDIWEELGRDTGCWNFAEHSRPDVVVAHRHYTRGQSERDGTYALAYDHWSQIDHPIWQMWRAQEKSRTCERILSLKHRLQASA